MSSLGQSTQLSKHSPDGAVSTLASSCEKELVLKRGRSDLIEFVLSSKINVAAARFLSVHLIEVAPD